MANPNMSEVGKDKKKSMTYPSKEDLDWSNIPEIYNFCPKCRDAAKNIMFENACFENDMLIYESEMNRIIESVQFQKSDELLCGTLSDRPEEGPEYIEEENEVNTDGINEE